MMLKQEEYSLMSLCRRSVGSLANTNPDESSSKSYVQQCIQNQAHDAELPTLEMNEIIHG